MGDKTYDLTYPQKSVVPMVVLTCGRVLQNGRTCPGQIASFERDDDGKFHLTPSEPPSPLSRAGMHTIETVCVKPGYSLKGLSVDDIECLADQGIVYLKPEECYIDNAEADFWHANDLADRRRLRENGELVADQFHTRLTCPKCHKNFNPSIEEIEKIISLLAGMLELYPYGEWNDFCDAQDIKLEGRRWPESDAEQQRMIAGQLRRVQVDRSPGTPVVTRSRLMQIIERKAKRESAKHV